MIHHAGFVGGACKGRAVQRFSRVDCGYASFLPLCPDCSWRGLPRASRDDAAGVADRHAATVHGNQRARDAAALRDRRLVSAR